MRRRLWLNVVVVLVALVLAAIAWLDYQQPDDDNGLTSLRPDDVGVIRVQREDGDGLRMERQGDGWLITDPVTAPASTFHVEQLLELTRAPRQASYEPGEVDPEALGLIPPRIKIAFDGTGIGLGDAEGELRYAMTGNAVHLIPDGLMPLISGPWWNFLDRHVLADGIEPIALKTDDLELRREAEHWDVTVGDLDDDAAAQLMDDWMEMEALVARPLDEPPGAEADVTLRLENGTERRFAALEEDGEVRLVDLDSGVAYVMSAEVRAYLLTGEEPQGSAE